MDSVVEKRALSRWGCSVRAAGRPGALFSPRRTRAHTQGIINICYCTYIRAGRPVSPPPPAGADLEYIITLFAHGTCVEPGRRIGAQRDRPSTMGPRCLCAAPTSIIFFIFRIKSSDTRPLLSLLPLHFQSSSTKLRRFSFPSFPLPDSDSRKENSSARGILLGVPRGVERTAAREESEKSLPLSLSLTIRFERGQGLIEKNEEEREIEICTTMNSEGWS